MNVITSDIIFPELFKDVQLAAIFKDGKTFADAIPTAPPTLINSLYLEQKDHADFNLRTFVEQHFSLPKDLFSSFKADTSLSVQDHIASLWPVLKREEDAAAVEGDSRISIPFPYIVPGGRFNEIYYWDSYFTMLGLQVAGKIDEIENMVKNFAWMIDQFGHIPNGNRSYFLSRSQPPFFALMVQLLAEEKGEEIVKNYLPQLEKEYNFWMGGIDSLNKHESIKRVIKLEDGTVLNRYWDNANTPRQEMYKDDVELAENSNQYEEELFRNIRAACESGWDFSSRWCTEEKNLGTINTAHIIPLDLNCLLYTLEKIISNGYKLDKQAAKSLLWNNKAIARAGAIRTMFWDKEKLFYFDLDAINEQATNSYTLAAMYPLFLKIANDNQAKEVAAIIESKFLQAGGVVTTLVETGQQWDWPNGWAPLQWVTIKGLRNYGYEELANKIANRWMTLNEKTFKNTGKMLEKYNVVDLSLEAGGGEYPVQDGFGWTNGVYLRLVE